MYYTEIENSTSNHCRTCPEGANCGIKKIDEDGLSLQKIISLPGWWRASINSSNFLDCRVPHMASGNEIATARAKERCCPLCNITQQQQQRHDGVDDDATTIIIEQQQQQQHNGTTTPFMNNDTNAQCLKGYVGPYCASCNASANYLKWGNECQHCVGGSSVSIHIGMWIVVGVLVMLSTFTLFGCLLKPPKDELTSAKRDALLSNGKILWDWGQLFASTPNTVSDCLFVVCCLLFVVVVVCCCCCCCLFFARYLMHF